MLRVEHECELVDTHEDMLFLPDRSIFQKALDALRYLLMASDKNPGARKYLRSRASIIWEKRRHLRNYRYIIHPFSMLRYSYHILLKQISLYNVLKIYIYNICNVYILSIKMLN